MSIIDAHRVHQRDAFLHPWESLEAVLEDVGDEIAEWVPSAYKTEPREAGWPRNGSIRWHVAHLAHCKRYYTEVLRNLGTDGRPPVDPRVPVETYAQEKEAMLAAHEALDAEVQKVQPDQMKTLTPTGMPVEEFLALLARHDAWHGGQMAMVKRLWKRSLPEDDEE